MPCLVQNKQMAVVLTVSILAGRGSVHGDGDDVGTFSLKSADARSARPAFRDSATAAPVPRRQVPGGPSGNVAQLWDPKRCTHSIWAPTDCLQLLWESNVLCH